MITNQQVKQIADEIYDYMSKDSTLDQVFRGDLSNPILPDYSFEKLKETEAYAATIIEKIDHLSKESLDHYDEVALGVMRFFAQFNFSNGLTIYSTKNYYLSFEITPYSCILPYLNNLGAIPIRDQEAALQYIKLIEQYPRMVRQIVDKTKKQSQMEIYLPKEELELVIDMLKGLLIPADQHPLVLNEARLGAVPNEKESLIKHSQTPISEAVEMIRELIEFLQSEDYQSKLKMTVGVGQYPGGSEYYQYLANYHTTDEVSAEELYRVGLEQMEVIENRMAEIRKALG